MTAIISLKFMVVLDDSDRPIHLRIYHRIDKRKLICCAHQLFPKLSLVCHVAVLALRNFTPCTRSRCAEKNFPAFQLSPVIRAMDFEGNRLIKIIQSYHDFNRLLNFREIIVPITSHHFSNFSLLFFLKIKFLLKPKIASTRWMRIGLFTYPEIGTATEGQNGPKQPINA